MADKESKEPAETKVTTNGSTVRVQTPHAHGQHKPHVSVFVGPELVTGQVGGFVTFLREHAIVGLAIGFVFGTQVQAVITQLISNFINPLFQLLFPGNKTLNQRTFTWHFDGRHANFGWGAVVYQFLDFFFIALTVYILIKLFKLNKLDKPAK